MSTVKILVLKMPRIEPPTQFQIGPTLLGKWQVLDLQTGLAAKIGGLTADSMSKDEAMSLSALLNDIAAEKNEDAGEK